MSRSNHHGCGKCCGMCKPHKKWKSNSIEDQKPSVQRALQDDPIADEDLRDLPRELEADPAWCPRECCQPSGVCTCEEHRWRAITLHRIFGQLSDELLRELQEHHRSWCPAWKPCST